MRLLLLAPLLASSGFALAGSYYPSAPGTTWQLSNGEIQKLAPVERMRGATVTPLQHFLGGKLISEDLLEFGAAGVRLRGTRASGKVSWFGQPLTVYPPSPLAPGQSWQSGGGDFTLRARVIGQQPVVTQAGKFNALVIRNEVTTSSGGASVSDSYFVPGVGTVRYQGEGSAAVDLVKR